MLAVYNIKTKIYICIFFHFISTMQLKYSQTQACFMDGVCMFVCLFYIFLSTQLLWAQTSAALFLSTKSQTALLLFFFLLCFYILNVYFILLLLFASFLARNHILVHYNGKICYLKSVNITMRLGAAHTNALKFQTNLI